MMLIFLTACSSTPTHGNNGLSVPSYTKAQTQALYLELYDPETKTIKAPMSVVFLKDYGVLRDQVGVK